MRPIARFLAVSFTIAAHLFAQPPAAPPQVPAKLSTRSDLVLVPVVVTDKSGKPVSGLTKDSFQVEENGKLRSLSLFEEAQTEKLPAPLPQSLQAIYSNFLPRGEHSLRLTIFVLDMLNTPWLHQTEAKKQLIDYLLRVASRDEPMAIFGLTSSGLHQIHPFTRDSKVLVLALQKLKLSLSSEERTQPPATLTEDPYFPQTSDEVQIMSDIFQDLDDTITANHQRMATRQTLAALTQLARAFHTVPGRKTLIWATAGFPFTIDDPNSFARQGDDLRPEYEDAWRSLDSANIAVYPVDLGSVDFTAKNLPSSNATLSSRQLNNIQGLNGMRSATQLPYDQGTQQRLSMHAFADATGGRACITISELEKCFAEAIDDSRVYYVLGYYLGDDTQPGWRKLKVKVAGNGLHVRSRTGFYVPSKLEDTPAQRRKELVDALASPLQYAGLRLTARLMPPAESAATSSATQQAKPADAQAQAAEFMLGIMGDSITVDRENGNAIDFQITTLAFDNHRKSVATSTVGVATKLQPERLQKIFETGLGIPQKVELPPGKYEIKFAVRDNLTGLIGTVAIPLDLR